MWQASSSSRVNLARELLQLWLHPSCPHVACSRAACTTGQAACFAAHIIQRTGTSHAGLAASNCVCASSCYTSDVHAHASLHQLPPSSPLIAVRLSHRYLPHAFIVNNAQVEGPILCLPDTWLLWDVQTFADINPQTLAILDLLDPPPEVLVVGCGAKMQPLPQQLNDYLRARNIAVESLDTVSVGRAASNKDNQIHCSSSSCCRSTCGLPA